MPGLNFRKASNLTALSGMPQMSSTLSGWEVPLELVKITQSMDEGDVIHTEEKIKFKGVWQPLKNEELALKPEGQRSWQWIWIHAVAGTLNLSTADKVIFNNRRYKVVQTKDYSLNGFIEYQLVEDFVSNPTKKI